MSGLPLFLFPAPFPQALPPSKKDRLTMWGKRVWAERKQGQSSRALPVSQRSARKGLSVRGRGS